MTVLQHDGQVVFNNITASGILDSTAGAGYVSKTGDTMTGKLVTASTALTAAGFGLPHGTPPSSPVNGDLWSTTGGLYVRINSVTHEVTTSTATQTHSDRNPN